MMPKLTNKLIDASLTKQKDYIVWDDEVKGFGCRILPTGYKTYVFFYTSPLTRKYSYLKIGIHGNISADVARKKAKNLSTDIVNGLDPKEQKKALQIKEQHFLSFEDFFEIFRQKYILEKHKPSTIHRDEHRINKYILPFFGKKKIGAIIQDDVISFVSSMKHARGNCNKCLILLSTAFNQAEKWGYREKNTNPCQGVEKSPDKKMERFLSKEEYERLERILSEQEKISHSSPYTIAAIRMLLYTGCRCGEILTLKWSDVFMEEGYIHLQDSKTGAKTFPLNSKAIDLLKNLKKDSANLYVFHGKTPGSHLSKIETTWHKVRHLAGIPDVRIHDLRHSFASFALKKGVDLYTVSKLLGHKNIATTTRYAHLELEHLKKATNKVAEVFG
ncbi:tyrosine recombinase XerD [Caedimonas varicaedens]|uniref:Tyrosine recombinase XerD n=1 Tax=Caedimonas varicaedens TaxID=1629334 RepID=A0A0K8MAP2_9PROT|nr:tyrosine recombinase XerD [Caedimonas varicaedens]